MGTDEIPLRRLVAAARDEVKLRQRVYPRWVANGRMDQEKADRRIAEMQAIADLLERLRVAEQERIAPQLFGDGG